MAGTLPASLGALTSLTSLDLSSNALTGTVPAEVAALYLPCEGGNIVDGINNTVGGCFNVVTGSNNNVDGRGNRVVGKGAPPSLRSLRNAASCGLLAQAAAGARA